MSLRSLDRRLASLLIVLALIGAPALALRMLCVGHSCDDRAAAAASVPFCPLPAVVRADIVAGFRAGRSPDVMATTGGARIVEPAGGGTWPSATPPDLRVPIAFLGRSVDRDALPDGMGLDDIAPTIARMLDYDRGHPEVRAGTAIALNNRAGTAIPLVVEIVWRGVGTVDVGDGWPARSGALVRSEGAGTMTGDVGSLPLDPAATLTTIGTGGLPFQHGITGSLIRNDRGRAVAPWTAGAPTSVISTLGDDLRHSFGERSRVGIVATERSDRGLIGTGWYLGADAGDLVLGSGDPSSDVMRLLDQGYGASDGAPDMLGVVAKGPIATLDVETDAIVHEILLRIPDALVVLAGSGDSVPRETADAPAVRSSRIVRIMDASLGSAVVTRSVAGGLFLDPEALDASNLTADAVVQQMRTLSSPGAGAWFSQVFPGFSVAFARYC